MRKCMEFRNEIVVRADFGDPDTRWEFLEPGFKVDAPLTGDVVGDDFVKRR